MIVKIEDQYMIGDVLTSNGLPDIFEFFPAYKASGVTYCYVTDGMENEINVPFQAATINDLASATPIVGESMLSDYGLPHGQ